MQRLSVRILPWYERGLEGRRKRTNLFFTLVREEPTLLHGVMHPSWSAVLSAEPITHACFIAVWSLWTVYCMYCNTVHTIQYTLYDHRYQNLTFHDANDLWTCQTPLSDIIEMMDFILFHLFICVSPSLSMIMLAEKEHLRQTKLSAKEHRVFLLTNGRIMMLTPTIHTAHASWSKWKNVPPLRCLFIVVPEEGTWPCQTVWPASLFLCLLLLIVHSQSHSSRHAFLMFFLHMSIPPSLFSSLPLSGLYLSRIHYTLYMLPADWSTFYYWFVYNPYLSPAAHAAQQTPKNLWEISPWRASCTKGKTLWFFFSTLFHVHDTKSNSFLFSSLILTNYHHNRIQYPESQEGLPESSKKASDSFRRLIHDLGRRSSNFLYPHPMSCRYFRARICLSHLSSFLSFSPAYMLLLVDSAICM